MKIKRRHHSLWKKQASNGFRGYPLLTVAFYGPDDSRASKVALGLLTEEGADPLMTRLFSEQDARFDPEINARIEDLIREHGIQSVAGTNQLLGCPHEEGTDYPEGASCPECPFWAHRDRWTGIAKV